MIQQTKKSICWGIDLFNTHHVTSIQVDYFSSMVHVVIEKGLDVQKHTFSMEHAQEIGFINFNALLKYCK